LHKIVFENLSFVYINIYKIFIYIFRILDDVNRKRENLAVLNGILEDAEHQATFKRQVCVVILYNYKKSYKLLQDFIITLIEEEIKLLNKITFNSEKEHLNQANLK
jgi:hypothetical protein